MKSHKFIKKIRIYATVSFLLPLIAIISCLNVYKLLGQIEPYYDGNWNEKEIEYPYAEYSLIANNLASYTLTNCPKYILMIEIDPDLVMANFSQSMLGFFQILLILGVLTVGAVWFWLYWQSTIDRE